MMVFFNPLFGALWERPPQQNRAAPVGAVYRSRFPGILSRRGRRSYVAQQFAHFGEESVARQAAIIGSFIVQPLRLDRLIQRCGAGLQLLYCRASQRTDTTRMLKSKSEYIKLDFDDLDDF